MVLEIIKYGNPVLRAKGLAVGEGEERARKLAEDMIETMRAANGVGLAAQQIGVPIQLAVIDVSGVEDRPSELIVDGKKAEIGAHMPMVLVNPVIVLGKETEEGVEGCLSFPELSGDIVRATSVKVKARKLDGTPLEFEARGLLCRAVQHEVDHLNGILFIDRMNSATRTSLAGKLKRLQKLARA
ncbi:MAG: peptide deformylase [Chthoniobacteraceae bacterium]